jgi:hypothetical protein
MLTMCWKNVGGTLLVVHGRLPPDAGEWAVFLEYVTAPETRVSRCLVFSDIALTAEQRRQVAAATTTAGMKGVAVITSSALARMIVTALSWVRGVHKAFEPRHVRSALDYLGVPDQERGPLLSSAAQFARDLDHPRLAQTLSPP